MDLLEQIEVALSEIGRDPNASPESAALWTRWLRCTSDTERLEVLLHGIKVYDSVLMAVREAHCKTLARLGPPPLVLNTEPLSTFQPNGKYLVRGSINGVPICSNPVNLVTAQSWIETANRKFGSGSHWTEPVDEAVNHGSQTEEKAGEAS